MSALLGKLKSLINARVRGPRSYRTDAERQANTAEEKSPQPEVTEAPARLQRLPEVTEAPEVDEAPARRATPTDRPTSRIEEPQPREEEADALEEERVVDLLKGKKS